LLAKAFKQLLPRSSIFFEGDKDFEQAVESLTRQLELFERYSRSISNEIPGQLDVYLARWHAFLFRKQQESSLSSGNKNRSVALKLGQASGCTIQSLEKYANTVSINEVAVKEELLSIKFIGTELTLTDSYDSNSACDLPLRSFKREEGLIEHMKYILHAHLDRKYFDEEGKDYASN